MTMDIPHVVSQANDVATLVAQLEALSDDERTRWAEAMVASLPVWRRLLLKDNNVTHWRIDPASPTTEVETQVKKAFARRYTSMYRLILVAVVLGASPTQALSLFGSSTVPLLNRHDVLPALADAVVARGPDWTAGFVTGLTGGRRSRRFVRSVWPLVPRLVAEFDLPLPTTPDYLIGWAGTLPKPGRRWQEHFLAACATPGTFEQTFDRDKHIARIREGATTLRHREPTDDDALLDGLLTVIERGERPSTQREALAWIEGLDLDTTTRADRLLRILPVADAHVVAAFTRALLGTDLDDDALTQLAASILPRKEKGLKRDLLKRLAHLTTPTTELVELVTDLSRSTDTTTATLATTLCQTWGTTPTPEPETQGLWQDPSLPDPEPFPGLDPLILDDPALAALIVEIRTDWDEQAEVTERTLAQFVATANERGVEPVVEACRDADFDRSLPTGYLIRLLAHLGDGTLTPGTEPAPAHSPEGPLLFLAAQRARDVLHRLGELPSLLSTPSNARHEVTADDFRTRLGQYLDAGVALEPTDVAIALARMEPGANLTGCDAPIRGCDMRLTHVIDIWANSAPDPAGLELRPTGPRDEEALHVVGDVPDWHGALGLDTVWQHSFPCDTGYRNHHVADLPLVWPGPADGYVYAPPHDIVMRLIPRHLARPAWQAMLRLRWAEVAESLANVVSCIEVAPRVTEPVATAALAVAATIPAKDRDRIAAPLFAAWDEGRLSADDLLAGWRSTAWEKVNRARGRNPVDRSPAKITALLTILAEAGGLALVWPLLMEIAEEISTEEKIPAAASTVFETLLALLPEVPHPVELPNVRALATRKGSSKAITLARAITEKL